MYIISAYGYKNFFAVFPWLTQCVAYRPNRERESTQEYNLRQGC